MCASDVQELPAVAPPERPSLLTPTDYSPGTVVVRLRSVVSVLTEIAPQKVIAVYSSVHDAAPSLHIDLDDFRRFFRNRVTEQSPGDNTIHHTCHWRGVDVIAVEFVPVEIDDEDELESTHAVGPLLSSGKAESAGAPTSAGTCVQTVAK